MRGRRSIVEDYGKESVDESEISIFSSPTSGYVYRLDYRRSLESGLCSAPRETAGPVTRDPLTLSVT